MERNENSNEPRPPIKPKSENRHEIDSEGIKTINSHWNDRLEDFESLANEIVVNENSRVRRVAKILLRRVRDAMILAAMALVLTYANYERTRWAVTQENNNGSIIYRHEDKKTNDILNYISGINSLPENAKKELARICIMQLLSEVRGVKLPLDLEKRSDEDFRKFAVEALGLYLDTKYEGVDDQYVIDLIGKEDWFKHFTRDRHSPNSRLYRALWDIEQEAGNPKIRWTSDPEWINSQGFRASYDQITNTMYISPTGYGYGDINDLISESAHGKQFNENPLKLIAAGKDLIRIIGRSIITLKAPSETREELYNIPGSIEYEAHKEIQPRLEKEFWSVATGKKDPDKKKT